MKQNTLLIILVVAVSMASGGFFAGMKYQQSKSPSFRTFGGRSDRQNGNITRGFRPTAGQIVTIDATSMTVKLADGSTKIVLLNDKTLINKATSGAKSDLIKDIQVAVFGTENSDGSVTAQSIQLNPQEMRMMGGATPSTKAAETK